MELAVLHTDVGDEVRIKLWGYNPSFTRLTHATAAVAALKRGMRLIVVDPHHVGLASKADLWLRVRPGTDGALALGIASLMIERGWYDHDFIRDWSNGPIALIASRLISPASKLATARDLAADTAGSSLGRLLELGAVEESELYRALDWLGARQAAIETALARRHLKGRGAGAL